MAEDELVNGAGEVVATMPPERGAETIYTRLLNILEELPAIGKTEFNEQQKFHFRGHDAVLNALNPLLALHGVFVVPDVLERVVSERSTSRGSTMYEVNLHVRYTFFGEMGDWVAASAWGEGTDMGDKATNKAMTMAFKNVLAQVFAISTAELSDADGTSPEETTRGDRPAAAPRQQRQRQEPQREFDPGLDLLPNAITSDVDKFRVKIFDQLKWASPPLNWTYAVEQLVIGQWPDEKVTSSAQLSPEAQREFWTRLSNVAAKLVEGMDGGDFPPLSDAQIQETIAWGFNGQLVELVYDTPPAAETDAEPSAQPDGPGEEATQEKGAESAAEGGDDADTGGDKDGTDG